MNPQKNIPIDYFKNIDIGKDNIPDVGYTSFKSKIQNEVVFLDEKLKKGEIDQDAYNDMIGKIKDFLWSYDGKKEEIEQKYQEEIKEIRKDIGEDLSEIKDIQQNQLKIYDYFGIDRYTYKNDTLKRFTKGAIDTLIIDNYEMFEALKKEGIQIIIDAISNLSLSSILESLGDSIENIFSGDRYKMGRSFDLLLVASRPGVFLVKKGLKFAKEIHLKPKLDDNHISKLDDKKLIELLSQINSEKIDITGLSSENKQRIHLLLAQNFPLYGISRISSNKTLLNVNISGIKDLNDKYGQDFVDILNNNLRNEILNNLQTSGLNTRIIRSEYKNLSVIIDNNTDILKLFGGENNTKEVIKNIIEKTLQESTLKKEEYKKAREMIMEKYNFGVGMTKTGDASDVVHNIEYLRQAEIESRRNVGKKIENNSFYNPLETIEKINDAMSKEKEIIEKYNGKTFKYKGKDFTIITSDMRISSDLLRIARKNPEEIIPKELGEKLKMCIKDLNDSMDFISPLRTEISTSAKDIRLNLEIGKMMERGLIDKSVLTTTHKGGLNKEVFYTTLNEKRGTSIFIDIKDMGILNLTDYREKAKKIQILQEKLQKKEITQELYEKELYSTLLEAGLPVTKSFLEFQKLIQKKYPDASIYIGGDEIFVFTQKGIKVDLNEISDILKTSGLSGRIVQNEGKSSKGVFDKLDINSNINKHLEDIIYSNTSLDFRSTINISNLNIHKNNLEKIKKEIEEKLKTANLEQLKLVNGFVEISTSVGKIKIQNKGNSILEINKV